MAFFRDPFESSSLEAEDKLNRIRLQLKGIEKSELDSYIYIRGALEHDAKLEELFYSDSSIEEKSLDSYKSMDKSENEYISKLNEIKKSLEPEKPTSDAYHQASEFLEDKEVARRFEIDEYFPARERNIYFHLEFLFNNNPKVLMESVFPRLQYLKTKNMFSLLRFKFLDSNCHGEVLEDDDIATKKEKLKYFQFCESCISELSRFGNRVEKDGVFRYTGLDLDKENLLNLSFRLLLSILQMSLTRYLNLELTEEEIIFLEKIESGHKLIESANRAKKPFKEIEDAKKMVEELEKLRRLIELADESNLITSISDGKLVEKAEELVEIIEKAQGEYLRGDIYEADHSEYKEGELNLDSMTEDSSSDDSDETPLRKEFNQIEKFIKDLKTSKIKKREGLDKLISDSAKQEPNYYRYLNQTIYILQFFKFDTSKNLSQFLKDVDSYGVSTFEPDSLQRFYSNEELTVWELLNGNYEQLQNIYKKQFAQLKKFDHGFELAKQLNSTILKYGATLKELKSPD